MPEIRVQDEQGNIHVFPDGTTADMIAKAMNVQAPSTQSNADLDAQLHAAFDNRPLWRKVAGLDPDPDSLSQELKQHLAQQKQAAQKQIADQLGGVYSRYKEGVKQGLKTAPFMALPGAGAAAAELVGGGGAGLAANIATQGAGAYALSKAEGASTPEAVTSGVISAAGPAVEAALPAVATALKGSAAKAYEQVLKPTTREAKTITRQITPQLLEETPVAMTRKGLQEQTATRTEELGQQIESTVAGMKGQMPTKPVIDGLQNLKQAYQVNGVSLRPEVDSAIDTVSDTLKQLGPDVSYQDAVKARQILDRAVAEVKGYQGASLSDASVTAIRREAANSFREELAKASPDLAALNQKYRFWRGLSDVLDATVLRRTGQSAPLGEMLQTAAGVAGGAAKGGLGGAAGAGSGVYMLNKLMRSTLWRTVSAASKAKLANALASGSADAVVDVLSKMGAAQVGQNQ